MKSRYLDRLKVRRETESARRNIILGMVGGWLILLIGCFKLIYAPNADPASAKPLTVLGALLFCTGLLWPNALGMFEYILSLVAGWIGRALFYALLGIV